MNAFDDIQILPGNIVIKEELILPDFTDTEYNEIEEQFANQPIIDNQSDVGIFNNVENEVISSGSDKSNHVFCDDVLETSSEEDYDEDTSFFLDSKLPELLKEFEIKDIFGESQTEKARIAIQELQRQVKAKTVQNAYHRRQREKEEKAKQAAKTFAQPKPFAEVYFIREHDLREKPKAVIEEPKIQLTVKRIKDLCYSKEQEKEKTKPTIEEPKIQIKVKSLKDLCYRRQQDQVEKPKKSIEKPKIQFTVKTGNNYPKDQIEKPKLIIEERKKPIIVKTVKNFCYRIEKNQEKLDKPIAVKTVNGICYQTETDEPLLVEPIEATNVKDNGCQKEPAEEPKTEIKELEFKIKDLYYPREQNLPLTVDEPKIEENKEIAKGPISRRKRKASLSNLRDDFGSESEFTIFRRASEPKTCKLSHKPEKVIHKSFKSKLLPFDNAMANVYYECHICSKAFTEPSDLTDHIEMHLNDQIKYYECRECQIRFNSKYELAVHKRRTRHSECGNYECDFCGRRTRSRQTIYQHILKHLGIVPKKSDKTYGRDEIYKCYFCLREFKNRSNIYQHVIRHLELSSKGCDESVTQKLNECEKTEDKKDCEKTSSQPNGLEKSSDQPEILLEHQQPSGQLDTCEKPRNQLELDVCEKLANQLELDLCEKPRDQLELDKCEKPRDQLGESMECEKPETSDQSPKPDKSVHRKSKLLPYQNITEEVSFECHICSMKFKDDANLIAHFKSHSNSQRHQCEWCKGIFMSKKHFTQHKRDFHTLYECDICKIQFRGRKESITIHIQTHLSAYRCRQCGKRFESCVEFTEHYRSHTFEECYMCVKCNKGFKHKANLLMHLKMHKNEKLYECDICGRKLRLKNSFLTHLRKHAVCLYECEDSRIRLRPQ